MSGLQPHRVLWIRQMSDEEIRQVGDSGPTIDSIEVAEFELHAELKEWLTKKAPALMPEKHGRDSTSLLTPRRFVAEENDRQD
jgi:hypothetical protein